MARPLLRGEPATHVIAFRLTEAEYRWLTALAVLDGKAVGRLLADAVNTYAAELGEARCFPSGLVCVRSIVPPSS